MNQKAERLLLRKLPGFLLFVRGPKSLNIQREKPQRKRQAEKNRKQKSAHYRKRNTHFGQWTSSKTRHTNSTFEYVSDEQPCFPDSSTQSHCFQMVASSHPGARWPSVSHRDVLTGPGRRKLESHRHRKMSPYRPPAQCWQETLWFSTEVGSFDYSRNGE